jgi:hypothetical protein
LDFVFMPVGKFTDWNPVIAHPSNVYHSLWRKNSDGCSCPDVRVPDTIIFENGHPSVWYFTAADGQVKRKNSSNVTLGKIELALTKRTVPGGAVATVMHFARGGVDDFVIEHLGRTALRHFLHTPATDAQRLSVLQKFLAPVGSNNDVIIAKWSPQVRNSSNL